MSQYDRSLLPHALRALVDLLGEEAAFRLVEARGGIRLMVPMRATVEHFLMELIGAEAFVRLVSEYAGQALQLPKADKMLQQLKHRAVLRMYFHEHVPVPSIALKLNYTRTRVYQIIQAANVVPISDDLFALREDFDSQPDLFERRR